MSDSPFDPPAEEDDLDDIVRKHARNSLYGAAAAAIALGLFQWCCNPFFVVSILAAGAAVNAVRLPRQYVISLQDDYPADAGQLSTVCGYIGLVLLVLRLLLGAVGIAAMFVNS